LKEYVRCSKLKAFSDRVDAVVNEYFADNPNIVPGEEGDHCKKLINQKNWTKGNPTPSDVELAGKLVS
jgi:hypothetical protein